MILVDWGRMWHVNPFPILFHPDPGQGNTDAAAVHENHSDGEEISWFEGPVQSSLRLRIEAYVDVVL